MNRIVVALLLIYCAIVFADGQNTLITVGNANITIPTPSGFVDPGKDYPEAREEALKYVSKDNKLYSVLMLPAELDSFRNKQIASFSTFIGIMVPNTYISKTFSLETFSSVKNEVRKMAIASFDNTKNDVNELYKMQAHEIGQLQIDTMIGLGVLGEGHHWIVNGSLIQYVRHEDETIIKTTMLLATVYSLIKGKLVFFQIARHFNSVEDIKGLAEFTKKWSTSIMNCNSNK